MTEPGFVASRWSSPAMQAASAAALSRRAALPRARPGGDRDRPHGARAAAREHHREGLVGVRVHGAAARRAARRRRSSSLPEGADAAAREQAIDAADWAAPLREALLRLLPGGDGTQRRCASWRRWSRPARARSFAIAWRAIHRCWARSVSLWLPADDEVDLVVKGIVPRDPAAGSQRSQRRAARLAGGARGARDACAGR